MELLIIILNREEHLEKILSLLIESGITGATICETQGIGQFLAYEVPIFAGLKQFPGEGKTASKTILALLEEGDSYERFKKLLIDENIDFTKPQVGLLITVPVSNVVKPPREYE